MSATVKTALESGDAAALRSLLSNHPDRADELIVWGENGKNRTHPLHYVCDMLFNGTLPEGREMALVEALLDAGADVDFQLDAKRDTPLIGAASLHAEDVGIRLIEAGARPDATGGFGETALHWAAHEGLERLAGRLIAAGAPLEVHDLNWNATPLGWALHGWAQGANPGKTGSAVGHAGVVARLVSAGAAVDPGSLQDPKVRADPVMLAALRGERRRQ